ncbi:hypothetical protein PSHT_12241 [Puccinia striiformis]|uniref:Mitochondrial ATPase complex subunit ATP10 n=1 Tax=Puccinia striiformis TaxID=27350 RepID=A0A2S4UXY1_9BASI|nr:hypothetical protein PSHT_12241 [Puccinia striiformis]
MATPTRSTILRLSTQQFLRCSPPCSFSFRQSPRWYSSRPDQSTSNIDVHQTSPAEPKAIVSPSPKTPQDSPSEDDDRPKPPPYLPRPLGVVDPPSTRPPTEEEKLAKLVDERARLQERKHLISEVSRGYYHDWNQLRHNGNKLWTAPPSLIQDQQALYFPNISGVALTNKEIKHTTDIFTGKVSLLAVESTRMSEEHTRSFYAEPFRVMSEENNLQLVRLNVQENPLKSWLVSLFISNLRKTVPPKHHPGYILTNQSLEYVREPLGMVNKLLGYVYLVDWNKKVRWAGCGFSNADEVSALFSGTRTLLKRLEENQK